MNGLSLLDLLLVMAAVAASWRFFPHAPQPPPGGVPPDSPARPQPPGTTENRAAATDGKTEVPSALEGALKRICIASGYTDTGVFLEGARRAYETISTGFARGDMEPARFLLSREVHDVFAEAIGARNQRGETVEQTLIGIDSAEILDAGLAAGRAWIEVRFVAEVVSVTRDGDGRNVAGHPNLVVKLAERWTFERELRSAEPHWVLTATRPEA